MILLLACSTPDSPPPPTVELTQPVEVAEPAPVYVHASVLKLRDAPEGELLGRLAINSPLEVLEVQGDWTRVEVANGKQGWVGSAYLGEVELDAEYAVSQAEGEMRLEWLQRAAAIQPDRIHLGALANEYRTRGDDDRADIVEKQLRWPEGIFPLTHHYMLEDGQVAAQWRLHRGDEGGWESLQAQELTAEGLTRAEDWWLLPASGPAFKAKPIDIKHNGINECAGTSGVHVVFEAEAIAATRGQPPASWKTAAEPGLAEDEAVAKALQHIGRTASDSGETTAAPSGAGWLVRTTWTTNDEAEVEFYEVMARTVDVLVTEDEVGTLRDFQIDGMSTQILRGHRDLDGDGTPELVLGGCAASFLDGEGNLLRETEWACCGC